MATCLFKRNQNNEVYQVQLNNGSKSILFDKIASNPLIENQEAYDSYLNVYSKELKDTFGDWESGVVEGKESISYETGEPKLFYKNNKGELFDSYKGALDSTQGGVIEAGFVTTNDILNTSDKSLFSVASNDAVTLEGTNDIKLNNPKSFKTFLKLDATTDPSTKSGFINKWVKQGLIDGNKKLVGDTYYLKGRGEMETLSVYNSQLTSWEVAKQFGVGTFTNNKNGTFEITPNDDTKVTIMGKRGEVTLDKQSIKEQLKDGKFKELSKRYEGMATLAYKLFREDHSPFEGQSNRKISEVFSDKEKGDFRLALLNILSELGISVTSMTDYIDNYNTKEGTDPNVEALADIANAVIAFAEGKATDENLSEETAHFLIEAFENQDMIEELLPLVEQTEEWKRYSSQYYAKYSEKHSGKELDNIVRREVLGKILSRKLQDRFSVSQNEDVTLISKLRQIWQNFVNKIKTLFRSSHRERIDTLLDKIARKALNSELESFDPELLKDSNFTLYSLETQKAIVALTKARQSLERRLQLLQTTKDVSTNKVKQEVRKLNEAINNNNIWQSLNYLIGSTMSQYKDVKRQLDYYKNTPNEGNTSYFTHEEQQLFHNLVNDLVPILEELRSMLKANLGTDNKKEAERLIRDIDEITSGVSQLKGDARLQGTQGLEQVTNMIMDQYGLTEGERDYIETLIASELKDIGWFQKTYGSLEHSSNPFLGMLGKLISDKTYRTEQDTLKALKPFLEEIEEGGWNKEKFEKLLERDKDGNITGFTKSYIHWAEFMNKEKQAQVDAYNEVFGTNYTVEEYVKAYKANKIKKKIDFTSSELLSYDEKMDKWYEENTERRYTSEFYQKREKMYKDLDISRDTIEFLQELSRRRFSILSSYLQSGKIVDYSELSALDRESILEIDHIKQEAKSIIDPLTGERKNGEALKRALELQRISDFYAKENEGKERQIKKEFFAKLREVEAKKGKAAAFEWFKANAGLRFNQNFWGNISKNKKSISERLRELQREFEEDGSFEYADTIEEVLERFEDLIEAKKEILKQHQIRNNPSEIDYERMERETVKTLKSIEEELRTLYGRVNSIMRQSGEEEVVDPFITTENTLNEAYHKAYKDSGKSELEFLEDHILPSDKENVNKIATKLEKIRNGSNYVDRFLVKLIAKSYNIDPAKIDATFIRDVVLNSSSVEELQVEYARSRVMPYFRRFAPEGYSEFLSALNNGSMSISDLVTEIESNRSQGEELIDNPSMSQMLDISTHYTWSEETESEDYTNPNFDPNFEGGYRQPKMDKYGNDEFFSEFGIDKEHFLKTREMKATSNLEDFNMLERLWDLKRKGLEAYGEVSNNIYYLPQFSMGLVQRMGKAASKDFITTIGNSVRDLIYTRVDEKGYGEQVGDKDVTDFTDTRIIPKYGLRPLEEKSDLSTELAYSFGLFLHSAYEYKHRQNTISQAKTLEQGLLDANYQNGKAGEKTAAYEMFKNFLDAQYYGIHRSKKVKVNLWNGKEVDISKIALWFDKAVRMVNIGFSLPIAATSAVTAGISTRIESYIGEHINSNSTNWATKEFFKLAPSFIAESGKINRKSKLALLGEKAGLFKITERTVSSGYSRGVRLLNNLPYAFTEMANLPIAPRVMLSVLDDFRLVGDKIMDFNSFKKRSENNGLSKEELTKKWNTYRENSVYNLLQEKDGILDFSEELKEKVGEQYLEEQMNRIYGRVRTVNANIDTVVPQEDKSAATRHYLLSYTTAHRGWLTINIQRRLKRKHFNFISGQMEEGHYRTIYDLMNRVFKRKGEGMKALKEEWNNLSEYERRNIKRTLVDLGAYTALLALGLFVAAAADDDDNKDDWMVQFAAYIYFRTASEVGSAQAPTGIIGLVDVVESPFIAINSIKEIADLKGWSLEDVHSGAYKGHSKLYRKMSKLYWARHYYDLKGIRKKSQNFRRLNAETLLFLGH